MSTSGLQAHLHSTCKIVDYSDTLLSRYCPDFGSDGCLQFRDSLGIVLVDIIYKITPQIKIWSCGNALVIVSSVEGVILNGLHTSPDLNPPDFYLWGYLKDNVYHDNPHTIPELKTAITTKIRTISGEECVRVIDNFACRIQVCLQPRGGYLEHIIERP